MNALVISVEDIKDVLIPRLDREPTKRELELFKDYLENNLPHWLVDNAKHWIKEVLPDEE